MPTRLLLLAGVVFVAWIILNEFTPTGRRYISRFIKDNVANPDLRELLPWGGANNAG